MEDAATLRARLLETEQNLSEVIDEVNFAEEQRTQAEARAVAGEQRQRHLAAALENCLAYAARLQQDIIVPAVGDLAALANPHLAAARAAAIGSSNDAVASLTVSNRVAPLLQRLAGTHGGAAGNAVSALQTRESALSGAERGSQRPVAWTAEDCFVLCDSLHASRQQLSLLIANTTQCLEDVAHSTGAHPPDSATAKAELESLLRQAQSERDALSAQLGQQQPLEALQQRWHEEKAALQARVAATEEDRGRAEASRAAERQRVEDLQRRLDQAAHERRLISDERDALRSASTNGSAVRPLSDSVGPRKEEHELRMDLERTLREHSTTVTQLKSEIATLRVDAQVAQRDRAHEERQQEHLGQLDRNNALLRQDIARLQRELEEEGRRRHAAEDEAARRGSSSQGPVLEAKVRQFEGTITQLNQELALVDQKIRNVERSRDMERDQLTAAAEADRARYQREREDTDALVLRMTNELEFLIRENQALKGGTLASPQL